MRNFYGIMFDAEQALTITKLGNEYAKIVKEVQEPQEGYEGRSIPGFPRLKLLAQMDEDGYDVDKFCIQIDHGGTLEDFMQSRAILESSGFYTFLRKASIPFNHTDPSICTIIEWDY